MKKIKLLLGLVIIACFTFYTSCDSSGDGSVTTADLAGIWIAVGEDEGVGRAMLFEFSGNNFTRIAYTETATDMSQDEGEELVDINFKWVSYSESINIPFSLSGNTLTMTIPIGGDEVADVDFVKKSFSNPAEFTKTWYEIPDGEVLELNSNGAYTYSDGAGYTASGTWAATSDLYRFITTSDSVDPDFYYENLYDYTIAEGILTLLWGEEVKYQYSENAF